MNISVVLFFLHNVFATALLGGLFAKKSDVVFKSFGIGLLFDAIAFTSWSLAVMMPSNLFILVTIGAICFLISLVFFARTGVLHMSSGIRSAVTALSVLSVVGVFIVGRYVAPADASISAEGFLFFNLTPLVQMCYLFVLSLAAFPAIDAVTAKLNPTVSMWIKYGLIAEVAGGVLLITTIDSQVLYLAGWVIGIVYFGLWTTLLLSKTAWHK